MASEKDSEIQTLMTKNKDLSESLKRNETKIKEMVTFKK